MSTPEDEPTFREGTALDELINYLYDNPWSLTKEIDDGTSLDRSLATSYMSGSYSQYFRSRDTGRGTGKEWMIRERVADKIEERRERRQGFDSNSLVTQLGMIARYVYDNPWSTSREIAAEVEPGQNEVSTILSTKSLWFEKRQASRGGCQYEYRLSENAELVVEQELL